MRYQTILLTLLFAPQLGMQSAPVDPAKLAARDSHQNLLVAADPYMTSDRYKDRFGKKTPYDAGILAIDVYFRNDNEMPIHLKLETIHLVYSPGERAHQELEPLSPEEVADLVLRKQPKDSTVPRPIPFPHGAGSSTPKGFEDMVTSLRAVSLSTDVLPPHGTIHGFLFFNMNHDFAAVRQSKLSVPDLYFMLDEKPLFFFEVPLSGSSSQ